MQVGILPRLEMTACFIGAAIAVSELCELKQGMPIQFPAMEFRTKVDVMPEVYLQRCFQVPYQVLS